MKRYPSISNYAETILHPEGRFRKLTDIVAVKAPGMPVSYTLSRERVNFRVLCSGRECILSCRLTASPLDDREERAIKDMADVDSPHLMRCEYLRDEIYVFDNAGNGAYHDVIVTEHPDGIPLYKYLSGLSSSNDKQKCEEFLHRFLDFATRIAVGKKFSHNNLKPKNVFVCGDGNIRLTDYRLLAIPGGGLSESDGEFLSVTALTAYALSMSPGIFKGRKEEFFSCIEAMKEVVSAIFPGSERMPLERILEEAPTEMVFPSAAGDRTNELRYEFEGKHCEGLASVVSEGKFGYAATNGSLAIPARYDWGGDFEEGLAIVRKDGEMGLIDKRGNEIMAVEYEDISWWPDNGVILACKDGCWRFYDREGNQVSREAYDNVGDFSEGLVWVMRNGKYGFADRRGRTVLPLIYDDAASFNREGYAAVQLGRRKFTIDTKGKQVVISG